MMKLAEEYVNFLIPLPSQARVAGELRRLKRTAVVMPAHAGFVVACDEDADSSDLPMADRIATLYSKAFTAPTLAAGCAADAFFFSLVEGSKVTATYSSTALQWSVQPEAAEDMAAVRADCKTAARRLCVALGKAAAVPYVQDVLLQPERFSSPVQQHTALVDMLGLPPWSVGAGFNGVMAGNLPHGLAADEVIQVG